MAVEPPPNIEKSVFENQNIFSLTDLDNQTEKKAWDILSQLFPL